MNNNSYQQLGAKYNLMFKSPEVVNSFYDEVRNQETNIAKQQGITTLEGLAELRFGQNGKSTY